MSNWSTSNRAPGNTTKKVVQDQRMRPTMARPSSEPLPKPNTNSTNGLIHQDIQNKKEKHKESSTTQSHKIQWNKTKKHTEGWKRGLLLDNTRSKN
eukprot:11897148-Ditylum_brightwellii.AAC.1